jgi:hypothetical protein
MPLPESSLIAPALLPFEVANVCLKKVRRHPDQRDGLVVAFGMVAMVEVDHGEVLGLPR